MLILFGIGSIAGSTGLQVYSSRLTRSCWHAFDLDGSGNCAIETLPAAGTAGVLYGADAALQGPRQDAGRLFDSDDNPGVALVQRIYNYCR